MKWRAFSRMPQWVRLSEWLGRTFSSPSAGTRSAILVTRFATDGVHYSERTLLVSLGMGCLRPETDTDVERWVRAFVASLRFQIASESCQLWVLQLLQIVLFEPHAKHPFQFVQIQTTYLDRAWVLRQSFLRRGTVSQSKRSCPQSRT